jgi:pullulanase
MGMLDVPLMNRIQEKLDKRFGKGEKLLYGEPWAGGECHPRTGTELAHKGNLKKLMPAIGAFCDNTRDAVKGSVMDEKSCGFVNGGGLDANKLACCIRAWAGETGDFAVPFQTITYLSAHDDWTLWDKLVCTLDEKRDFTGLDEAVIRANKLAFAILSMCQGHLFFLSGEEFGRTKKGVKNSYRSPLDINAMDWPRCAKNRGLVEYYRGLIALRKLLPGVCDKSAGAGARVLGICQKGKDAASIMVDNGADSPWTQLLLCFNASDKDVPLNLPAGEWAILADGESSFRWQQADTVAKSTIMKARAALILGKIKE